MCQVLFQRVRWDNCTFPLDTDNRIKSDYIAFICDSRYILGDMIRIQNDLEMLGNNSPKLFQIHNFRCCVLYPSVVNQPPKRALQSNRVMNGSVVKDTGPRMGLAGEDGSIPNFSERSFCQRGMH